MKPIYLRREREAPCDVPVAGMRPAFEVCAYRDKKCDSLIAIFSAGASKPLRGCRSVILNCVSWPVVWLPTIHRI